MKGSIGVTAIYTCHRKEIRLPVNSMLVWEFYPLSFFYGVLVLDFA